MPQIWIIMMPKRPRLVVNNEPKNSYFTSNLRIFALLVLDVLFWIALWVADRFGSHCQRCRISHYGSKDPTGLMINFAMDTQKGYCLQELKLHGMIAMPRLWDCRLIKLTLVTVKIG